MKKFTAEETRDLFGQVVMGEISLSRMVGILNEMVSEAEDIPAELKDGDLAIFWNGHPKDALIRLFDRYISPSDLFSCVDKSGSGWKNAIKFESKEQFNRLIKGEI